MHLSLAESFERELFNHLTEFKQMNGVELNCQ